MAIKQKVTNAASATSGSAQQTVSKAAKTRKVALGDTPPDASSQGIEKFSIHEKIAAARESKSEAVQDIISRIASHNNKRCFSYLQ